MGIVNWEEEKKYKCKCGKIIRLEIQESANYGIYYDLHDEETNEELKEIKQ